MQGSMRQSQLKRINAGLLVFVADRDDDTEIVGIGKAGPREFVVFVVRTRKPL
jgi:hypothetical protein